MHLTLDPAAQDLLFRQAHTAYAFTDEPVTDEQIQAIHDLVKYGPTAFNQQSLRIFLIRTPEGRERLLKHIWDGNKEKTANAPLTAILAADNEFHEALPHLYPAYPDAKDSFFSERPVREASARLNSALQAAYFLIGIRAAGLAAGPMTGFDAKGLDKEFFGDGQHSSLIVVNIGNPSEDAFHPRNPRMEYHQVVTTA